ncbi:MAG: DnaJ domain-containing protein [archaeon]|nr:DnaJ domain-containing protein [archaeon]
MAGKSHYELLGVDRGAAAEQVQAAWKRVAKELHPDRNPSADAQQLFMEAKQASVVLLDAEKRAHYDRSLLPPAMASLATGSKARSRPHPSRLPGVDPKQALRDLEERERQASAKRQRTGAYSTSSLSSSSSASYSSSSSASTASTFSSSSSSSSSSTSSSSSFSSSRSSVDEPMVVADQPNPVTSDPRTMSFADYEQLVLQRLSQLGRG